MSLRMFPIIVVVKKSSLFSIVRTVEAIVVSYCRMGEGFETHEWQMNLKDGELNS